MQVRIFFCEPFSSPLACLPSVPSHARWCTLILYPLPCKDSSVFCRFHLPLPEYISLVTELSVSQTASFSLATQRAMHCSHSHPQSERCFVPLLHPQSPFSIPRASDASSPIFILRASDASFPYTSGLASMQQSWDIRTQLLEFCQFLSNLPGGAPRESSSSAAA